MLEILYWVILVLALVGVFVPDHPFVRFTGGVNLILFILLGLRVFPTSFH